MPSRKGRGNKDKVAFRAALRKYAEDKGVDPHYWMVDLLKRRGVKLDLKFQAAKELAQYLQPKLRAVELSGDPDRPLVIQSPDERRTRINELLAKRNRTDLGYMPIERPQLPEESVG